MEVTAKIRHGPKRSGLLLIKDRFHHQTSPASGPGTGSSRRCYSPKEATDAKDAELKLHPSNATASPSSSSASSSTAAAVHVPVTRRLNSHMENEHGRFHETISSPERQRSVLPSDVPYIIRGPMQHQQTCLPQLTSSTSATPPSGISNQRSQHLRDRQRLTRKISSPRRMLAAAAAGTECVASDDERRHHLGRCQEETDGVGSASDSFRRRDRLRSSLPVVGCRNKSLERPLGMVFLTYRNETKRGLLPNEITSISTVWALFVRAFPDHLTMKGFEATQVTLVCILNRSANAYRPLTDLREVVDQSALLVPCMNDDDSRQMSRRSVVSGKSSQQQQLISNNSHRLYEGGDRLSSMTNEASKQRKQFSSMDRRLTGISDGEGRPKSYNADVYNDMSSRGDGGLAMRPRTASDGSSRSDGMDCSTRDRLTTVESQLASLRSMVRAAMKQDADNDDDDDDGMRMMKQQQQLLPPLPLHPHQQQLRRDNSAQSIHSCNSVVTVRSLNGGYCRDVIDIRDRLSDVMRQLKIIRNEVRDVRLMQMNCSQSLEEANRETVQKIQMAVVSFMKSIRSQRQTMNAEKLLYKEDKMGTETRLRCLEESVQGLRKSIVGQNTEVTVSEVERMVIELTRINKSLTAARGKFRNIQEQMTSIVEMESEEDDDLKRFLEEEPKQLERLFSRCRQVTGSLTVLKKVAVAQYQQNGNGSDKTTSTHFEERSENPTLTKQAKASEEVLADTSHASLVTKSLIETKTKEDQSSGKMDESVVRPSSCTAESQNKRRHRMELPIPRRPDSATSLGGGGGSLLPRMEPHTFAAAAIHPISTRSSISGQSSPSSSSSSNSSSSSSSVTMTSPVRPSSSDCSLKLRCGPPPDPPVRRLTRIVSSKEVPKSSHRANNVSSTEEGVP